MLACSNAEDLLKWYNTFTTHPEVVGLSKEALKNLTTPIQPLGIQGLKASFGQGIVATGNKNVTNKVCTSLLRQYPSSAVLSYMLKMCSPETVYYKLSGALYRLLSMVMPQSECICLDCMQAFSILDTWPGLWLLGLLI